MQRENKHSHIASCDQVESLSLGRLCCSKEIIKYMDGTDPARACGI